MFRRPLLWVGALLALLAGVAVLPLPLPLGAPLLFLALGLMLRASPQARRQLGRQMRRHPRLRRLVALRKIWRRRRQA